MDESQPRTFVKSGCRAFYKAISHNALRAIRARSHHKRHPAARVKRSTTPAPAHWHPLFAWVAAKRSQVTQKARQTCFLYAPCDTEDGASVSTLFKEAGPHHLLKSGGLLRCRDGSRKPLGPVSMPNSVASRIRIPTSSDWIRRHQVRRPTLASSVHQLLGNCWETLGPRDPRIDSKRHSLTPKRFPTMEGCCPAAAGTDNGTSRRIKEALGATRESTLMLRCAAV